MNQVQTLAVRHHYVSGLVPAKVSKLFIQDEFHESNYAHNKEGILTRTTTAKAPRWQKSFLTKRSNSNVNLSYLRVFHCNYCHACLSHTPLSHPLSSPSYRQTLPFVSVFLHFVDCLCSHNSSHPGRKFLSPSECK